MKDEVKGALIIAAVVYFFGAVVFMFYTMATQYKKLQKARSYCRYVMEIETAKRDKFTGNYYCELHDRVYPIDKENMDNYGNK